MKTISKILYNILSFSIFFAYKIENAYAVYKLTLVSYTKTTSCSSSYQNTTNARATVTNEMSPTTKQLCEGRYYFIGCTNKSSVDPSTLDLMDVYERCIKTGATEKILCHSCPKFHDAYGALQNDDESFLTYADIYSKTFTICDKGGFIEEGFGRGGGLANDGDLLAIALGVENTNTLDGYYIQTYEAVFEPELQYKNTISSCLINANKATTDNTGTFVPLSSCYYQQ